MSKITIQIDVTKIDKKQIKDGKYLKLEIVELKEPKDVTRADKSLVTGTKQDGTAWKLVKTHFVSMESVKNQDGTWTNGTIIGDASKFADLDPITPKEEIPYPVDDINPEDIPF